MANKQTAVEWLVEQLGEIRFISYAANCPIERGKLKEYIAKAKAMEKEQIMDANSCGFSDGINHEKDIPVNFISCEQYYNETFKSE